MEKNSIIFCTASHIVTFWTKLAPRPIELICTFASRLENFGYGVLLGFTEPSPGNGLGLLFLIFDDSVTHLKCIVFKDVVREAKGMFWLG